MLALYVTIWTALLLFVGAEVGRARATARTPPAWAWWVFTAGLALGVVHTILAFAVVHNWAHDGAVRNTSRQTEAVFGVGVGWGVYVNYVFLAVWLADALWWRAAPASRRPPAVTWAVRGFYLLIVVNAAVIFAAPERRVLGLLVICLLAWAWTRPQLARS